MLTAIPFVAPFLPNGSRLKLGEGPIVVNDDLYSIDALRGILRKTDLRQVQTSNVDLRSLLVSQGFLDSGGTDQTIGCVSPAASGKLLLALTAGIFLYDPTTQNLEFVAHPNEASAAQGGRYNDGKPGPDGALYVGGMSPEPAKGGGRLFRVDVHGTITEPLTGAPELFFPNGMHWNPTADPNEWILYYVDSKYPAIQVYLHRIKESVFERHDDLLPIPAQEFGFPDGMTGTDNGLLILALYNPDPKVDGQKEFGPAIVDIASRSVIERISVRVPQSTSVALNGQTLYLTSGAEGYEQTQFDRYPSAGTIFTASLADSSDSRVASARSVEPLTFKDI